MKTLDTSLNLNSLAVAFLHLCRDLPDQVGWDEPEYRTGAWYNGRERGWSLVVKRNLLDKEPLILTFTEHRNVDQLRIDRLFPASYDGWNPPVADGDIDFAETWENFRQIEDAKVWLRTYIRNWLEGLVDNV